MGIWKWLNARNTLKNRRIVPAALDGPMHLYYPYWLSSLATASSAVPIASLRSFSHPTNSRCEQH
jgi:hypothetical protein